MDPHQGQRVPTRAQAVQHTSYSAPRDRFFVLVALMVLWVPAGFSVGLNVMDEGTTVHLAWRLSEGEVLYRDSVQYYPPGLFYLLAGLFKIFGPSLLVSRLCTVVTAAVLCLGVYLLASRLSAPDLGLLSAFFVGTWYFYFHGLAMFQAITLCLFSCLCLDAHFRTRSRISVFAAGAVTGAMCLMRQFGGTSTAVLQLAVLVLFHRSVKPAAEPKTVRSAWSAVLFFFAGLVLQVAPVAAYLLARVPAGELFYQLVEFPLLTYPDTHRLPYPDLLAWPGGFSSIGDWLLGQSLALQFYVPFLIQAVAVLVLVWKFRSQKDTVENPRFWLALLLVLLMAFFWSHLFLRSDRWHLLPVMVFSLTLLAFVYERLTDMGREWLGDALVVLCVLMMGTAVWSNIRHLTLAISPGQTYSLQLPRAKGIQVGVSNLYGLADEVSGIEEYEACIRFIQERTAPNEPIFVGRRRHDLGLMLDQMFYFLSGRPAATRWHILHSGITDREDIQRKMIADLERRGVRYVVLLDFPEHPRNTPSPPGTSRLLDDYLKTRFELERTFGPRFVLRRRANPTPEADKAAVPVLSNG